MKGVILAGGRATRLYPATLSICKQLLPIFDKPMIYYPLSLLMLANIKEILIISTSKDISRFKEIFSDGSHIGLEISYAVQLQPKGLADAFIVAEKFIDDEPVCLVLGDNIFYGHDLPRLLQEATNLKEGAHIFGYPVKNPAQYGVVYFDENNKVTHIEEKPKKPASNYAVPGLYFYDAHVVKYAKSLKPSLRGELEITDLNNLYLQAGKLTITPLGRGFTWLDAGTYDDLQKASLFVQVMQERQGVKIACIEEIAYRQGFISKEQLLELAEYYSYNEYGEYLKNCLHIDRFSLARTSKALSKV